jgi:hypothetical protein
MCSNTVPGTELLPEDLADNGENRRSLSASFGYCNIPISTVQYSTVPQ